MARRLPALAAALVLAVSACGSDSSDDAAADTSPKTSSAEGSSGSTASSDTATSDAASGETGSDAAGDGTIVGGAPAGAALDTLITSFGIESTPELLECLAERGVTSGESGSEADMAMLSRTGPVALMGCAPEEMGAFLAEDITVPGLDQAQVECVVVETARAVGALNTEEVAAAMAAAELPPGLEASVIESAVPACELTAEQVQSVLVAQ
jgi:hypothetical protein